MGDVVDNAQPESDQLLDAGLAEHRRRQLAELALPINGLGLCHECDEPISAGRLDANPRAFRCIDCQTDIERQEARR